MTGPSGHTRPARAAPDAEDLLERARVAGDRGRPARAVALCRRALAALDALDALDAPDALDALDVRPSAGAGRGSGDGHPGSGRSLRVRIIVTLSYNLAELGRTAEAIDLLDGAAAIADPDHAAALQASRGLIYARVGDIPHAMADLDAAIVGLTGHDQEDLARTLLNRGLLHMTGGNLAAAQSDTSRAEAAATAAGADIVVFMARYNLGYLRFLAGDLPGSLHAMAEAEELAPDAALGVPALDRARVLLAAGLLGEAREYVDTAIDTFTRNRAMTDLTDALLVGADIAVAAGEPARARSLARRAARISARRGNTAAELLARLAEQRASAESRRAAARAGRPVGPARCRAAAASAAELAQALTDAGRAQDGLAARLLGVEALLDAGDAAAAGRSFRSLAGATRRLSLAGRLQADLMAARLALGEGRRTDGLRQLRRGLDDLGRFQALFGSQDLQAASSVWGRQLAAAGLRAAVDTGSPAQILQWLERSRASSTRLAHLRPPADPVLAAELGTLRVAEAAARAAMLAGRPDREREREVAELRRRVRARTWTLGGPGTVLRPPSLASVQRTLARAAGSNGSAGSAPGSAGRAGSAMGSTARAGPAPGSDCRAGSAMGSNGSAGSASGAPTVLAYFHGAGHVHALVVTATSARYHRLAPLDVCEELVRVAAADLALLAADRMPSSLRRVATQSLTAALRELSGQLVDPLGPPGGGPVLISGAGPLGAVPWPLLPALAGQPVSVTTSVSASIAGLQPRPPAHLNGVLAVAGPRVDRAGQEVRAVVDRYPGASALTGDAATGPAVLDRIPAGGLLHIAAHGHHESDSPLFSSVVLADGPLFAYDIAPNRTLPDQIVLSSCDVGRTAVRGDGEPLGLAAALLRSGVRTVIAAVAPVSDRAAAAVMAGYHDQLAAGHGPGAALAAALPLADDVPAAFCCFGAGGGATEH